MNSTARIKPAPRARIGLYSVGLKAYWNQFEGLKERLAGYGAFIESKLSEYGEVHNFGLVDDETAGRQAGEWFNARNVDLVFCHSATYTTSARLLRARIHERLQPCGHTAPHRQRTARIGPHTRHFTGG